MHLLILNTLLFSFSLHLGCPLREHHNRHLCKKVQRFLFILQFKLRNNLRENVNKMHSFYSWWDANFLLITRQQHPSFLLQRTTTILSMYSFVIQSWKCSVCGSFSWSSSWFKYQVFIYRMSSGIFKNVYSENHLCVISFTFLSRFLDIDCYIKFNFWSFTSHCDQKGDVM